MHHRQLPIHIKIRYHIVIHQTLAISLKKLLCVIEARLYEVQKIFICSYLARNCGIKCFTWDGYLSTANGATNSEDVCAATSATGSAVINTDIALMF